MSHKKSTSGKAGSSNDKPKVKITVLPSNVAVVSPSAEELSPLLEYQKFSIDDSALGLNRSSDNPELSPSSAFPAGLVPRFQAALQTSGCRVTVDDRRRSEEGLRVNREQCRESHGEAREFLRAVLAEPLGLVEFRGWHDFLWRIEQLCFLYPDARVLIVVDRNVTAVELYNELLRPLRGWLGLLAAERVGKKPRCLVTTLRWLPRLKPGAWQLVLPIVFSSKTLTEANYQAVVGLRARRVYTFVSQGLRLGKPTRLRLEAISGELLLPVEAS